MRRQMSPINKEMMRASIIMRIGHGVRIGYRWAHGMDVSIAITSTRGAIGSIQMEHGAKREI